MSKGELNVNIPEGDFLRMPAKRRDWITLQALTSLQQEGCQFRKNNCPLPFKRSRIFLCFAILLVLVGGLAATNGNMAEALKFLMKLFI